MGEKANRLIYFSPFLFSLKSRLYGIINMQSLESFFFFFVSSLQNNTQPFVRLYPADLSCLSDTTIVFFLNRHFCSYLYKEIGYDFCLMFIFCNYITSYLLLCSKSWVAVDTTPFFFVPRIEKDCQGGYEKKMVRFSDARVSETIKTWAIPCAVL